MGSEIFRNTLQKDDTYVSNNQLDEQREEIVIIGMAGRFPGARNIDEFWGNLRHGVESITSFTPEELAASGVDLDVLKDPTYVNATGYLEDADSFDASFFGISPREAEIMDPQHRIFLECAWAAIEHAGYDPDKYDGLIGVFGGVAANTYFINNVSVYRDLINSGDIYTAMLGSEKDFSATRVSYKLNLKGPSINVQSACSTSGVAVHLACQSLLNGECDMALAGGARVRVPLKGGYFCVEGGIGSPDGHCRAFDEKAQGIAYGSGVGMIVLKRLTDAVRDGDCIHALIKGSAINNDGSAKVGFTAPSIQGQAAVIEEALAMAEIDADTVGYVEAHGTGTALGDPVEIAALTKAFRKTTDRIDFCPIGSVKTNIGHLDAGAGVVGVIKTVLALKHKQLPPSLNFKKPNPQIGFENSPFYVNDELSEWKADGNPRRAGVSSFGLGGTNAHIVLEEAPEIESSGVSRPRQLLVLSAKTKSALDRAAKNLHAHLAQHPDINIADVAHTLKIGRKAFGQRCFLVCKDARDAAEAFVRPQADRVETGQLEPTDPAVAFMFPGQASQYVNMGLNLYEHEPVFRQEIDQCAEILEPLLGRDLRGVLYAEEHDSKAAELLENTCFTQPAMFTIEYALARLWENWGVRPAAMIGHSVGEYVAACLAGVFSLEHALMLVATRGRMMQELPRGTMLSVHLPAAQLEPGLSPEISIAAVNGPSLCVASGPIEPVAALQRRLEDEKVICRRLHTSHAFHSPMMDSMIEPFAQQVRSLALSPPSIPFISTVTGTWITPEQATDPVYWGRHLRATVRFADGIQNLLEEPGRVLLEVGPRKTSTFLALQQAKDQRQPVISSLSDSATDHTEWTSILSALGKLWLVGVDIDWTTFYAQEKRHRVSLPTYPFERRRYWIRAEKQVHDYVSIAESSSKQLETVAHSKPTHPDKKMGNAYDVPDSDIEQTLANIWQDVLGVEKVSVHDDFFDLGGDSLIALRLFGQIEKIFGKRIPLATLYEATTVEQLADILRKEEWTAPWDSLIQIQAGDSRRPLFLVHGAGGNVLIYRDLARHLGPDQPVHGLQAQGLDGGRPFHTRVEDMASSYLREMQRIQPEGPYLLGGFCLGGTVALEIAQQLRELGQEVALLALMETYNFSNMSDKSLLDKVYYCIQRVEFHLRNFLLLAPKHKLTFIKEKGKIAKGRRKVWLGMITSKIGHTFQHGNDQASLLFNLWEINDRAALNYVPKVYKGRITQFLPIKKYSHHVGPELGWDELAAGGLETHQLPVYPRGMLVEPFVSLLAKKLRACLDKAQNQS